MNEVKQQLRVFLKSKRLSMSPESRAEACRAISNKLKEGIKWEQMTNVHVFEPIESLGEVNLRELYKWIQENHPNINLYTSKKIGNDWRITKFHEAESSELNRLDLVIVPMLGFDKSLNRIGYGGGYYDNLLNAYTTAQKIGVCYESGRVKSIPTEPHDIKLGTIITEA